MGKTLLPIITFLLFFTVDSFAQLPVLIDFEDKSIWDLNVDEPELNAAVPSANQSVTSALSTIPDEDNRWVINDNYAGGTINNVGCPGGCPDKAIPPVPQQPSVITNANKQYLHTISFLGSKSIPPVKSSNYNAALVERRKQFARMNKDFSTEGFTDVKVDFWRTGGAGQSIYFSVDGGENWLLLHKISGLENQWVQESVSNALLNNKSTVRLGILWDDDEAIEDFLETTDSNGLDEISIAGTALVVAPTIISSISAATLCVGTTLPVTVSVTGTFNSGNVFTAQISDASGSFANARVIGNTAATTSGTFSATIPADIPEGSNYQVRVLSSSPVITSAASTQAITVATLPGQPQITVQGNTSLCPGEKVVLTATQASSYVWSTGATTQSIEVSQAGNYTVIIKNVAGCASQASLPLTVTVNTTVLQPAITITGNTNLCQGQKAVLTAPLAEGYLWSTGATSRSIEVAQTGNYTVKVKNTSGCESAASAAVAITVHAFPPKPVITSGSSLSFCKGGSVTLTAPESASYKWSTGATTRSITVGESGEYWLTTVNAASCESAASDKIKVTVTDLPITPVVTASGNTTFCEGDKVVLTASEASTYLWSNGASTRSIEVTAAGVFTVRVTNASGCESALSMPIEVIVLALPAKPLITVTGNSSICAGDSVILTAPQNSIYQWSTGATTQSIVVKETGIYRVSLQNAQGCGSPLSDLVSITVWQVPATPEIEQINLDTLTATITGAVYEWKKDGVVIPATTQKVKVSENGSYTVRIKDGNGCYSAYSPTFTFTMADKSLWNKINVFPNPTPGLFTLQIENSTSAAVQVQVITLMGQQLQSVSYLNSTKDFHQWMDATMLTKGTYVLKVTVGEEVMYRKFVIQ
jgi:hypothetical protein